MYMRSILKKGLAILFIHDKQAIIRLIIYIRIYQLLGIQ